MAIAMGVHSAVSISTSLRTCRSAPQERQTWHGLPDQTVPAASSRGTRFGDDANTMSLQSAHMHAAKPSAESGAVYDSSPQWGLSPFQVPADIPVPAVGTAVAGVVIVTAVRAVIHSLQCLVWEYAITVSHTNRRLREPGHAIPRCRCLDTFISIDPGSHKTLRRL